MCNLHPKLEQRHGPTFVVFSSLSLGTEPVEDVPIDTLKLSTMNQALLFTLLMCLAMASATLLGSKTKITPVINASVQGAADFAGSQIESSTAATVKVLEGTQQLVAGTLYDLKVAVTGPLGACRVFEVKVGEQPWNNPKYTLFEHKLTKETC